MCYVTQCNDRCRHALTIIALCALGQQLVAILSPSSWKAACKKGVVEGVTTIFLFENKWRHTLIIGKMLHLCDGHMLLIWFYHKFYHKTSEVTVCFSFSP